MAEEDEQTVTEQAADTSDEQAEKVETSEDKPEGEKPEGESDNETEKPKESGKEKDEGEKDEEDDEDKPRRPNRTDRYKRHIERLTREVAELRSRNSGSQEAETIAALVKQSVGDPPKEEDFKGDFLAYDRALTAYEVRKSVAEDRIKERIAEHQNVRAQQRAEVDADHIERVQEFRSKVKDWDQTMASMRGVQISPVVEDLIKESSKSGHLVYHLAKNPDRLERLNSMSEREAAREIGRIEARLSQPTAKTKSSAPKPVTPLKGGAGPSNPEKDLDAWLAKKYGKAS